MSNKSRLVNAKQMLNAAKDGKYAVAHINTNNMEWAQAILDAAQSTSTPVIIGVSEGAAKYQSGFNTVRAMVESIMEAKNIKVPVALHLDHGSYEGAIAALEAGFSSVMFDGSHYAFDENLVKTKELIKLAKKYNASLEVEVGSIGGEEDGVIGAGELADVEECRQIASLDIDMLAAGIGNIHGVYPENWTGLNFDRLAEIKAAANKPIVLHGGTGIPDAQIKRAIDLGVAKINVNTECQLAYAAALRKYFEANLDLDMKKKGFDPRKVIKPGYDAIKNVCIEKFRLFGSIGKAE